MRNIGINGIIIDSCDEEFEGLTGANQFVRALEETDDDVSIYINSPGGSVYGSREMGFALSKWCLAHPNRAVSVELGSLCASAAFNFVVALPRSCAVTAHSNSLLMAHSCSGGAIGNPEDLRSTAEEMDKINETVQNGLMMKTTLPVKQIKEAFLAGHEMWLTGKEAQECGLVNELVDECVMESFTALASNYATKYGIEQIVATYKLKQETIMEEENKTIIAEENQTAITAEATETEETTEETATAETTEETEETTAETEETTEETQECEDEEKTALKAQNAELTNKITALEAEISELKATIEKYKPTAKATSTVTEKKDWLAMVKELNNKHLPEQEYTKAYIAMKKDHEAEFSAFMKSHTSR
jgi:ATP-dependent protease ClpP protease subunit